MQRSSYAQILKASSIMGGAAGINLLLGMVRIKFAAVLMGVTGVGLISSFTALHGFIGTLAGLGLQPSAVRDIAAAVAKKDDHAVGRAVLTLRRLSWVTGWAGMGTMVLLSPLLSQLTFGHGDYTLDIAALGAIILLGNLSSGQMAVIQGVRRIGDMARANVYGAAAGTVAAIGLYAALGARGIIPSMVVLSAIQLALSFHFARRVPVPKVTLTWRQTFAEAGSMVRLGLVMMWSGLMGSAVAYMTVMLITQQEGTQAVGLYSAAFALSGIFINFVLAAMGADYYPRLASVAHDKPSMVRMVNEQTEIGVLLALPGLLATMVLAPWLLGFFYTREFLGAVDLLQWFILGCFGRVVSWPMGFVMLALGKGRWFLLTETGFNLMHIALVALWLHFYGIEGVAIAFVVMYPGYIAAVYLVGRHLIGFKSSNESIRIGLLSLPVLAAVFVVSRLPPLWPATLVGLSLTFVTTVFCMRGLTARVGPEHRMVRAITKLPGAKMLLLVR